MTDRAFCLMLKNQDSLQLFFWFPSQSCKAGKGPEFSKNVFDVHGRSPLIEQYLRSNHLSKDAGTAILVRRTEIESLPPYLFHSLEFSSHQKLYALLLSDFIGLLVKTLLNQSCCSNSMLITHGMSRFCHV